MPVHHIEGKSHLETVLNSAGNKLVVIDFYATWCGPCKLIAPKFQELSDKEPDVVFCKVDVDQNDDISIDFEISALPTFFFVKNNQRLHNFAGAKIESVVKAIEEYKNYQN